MDSLSERSLSGAPRARKLEDKNSRRVHHFQVSHLQVVNSTSRRHHLPTHSRSSIIQIRLARAPMVPSAQASRGISSISRRLNQHRRSPLPMAHRFSLTSNLYHRHPISLAVLHNNNNRNLSRQTHSNLAQLRTSHQHQQRTSPVSHAFASQAALPQIISTLALIQNR